MPIRRIDRPADALRRAAAPLVLALLGACGRSDQRICDPPTPPYAIAVKVLDAVTGEPIADRTIGWADAGEVHDTLVYYPGDASWLYSKQNAPGSYRVVLRRPGYRDWISTVEAVPRPCGGARGVVTARLERRGPDSVRR